MPMGGFFGKTLRIVKYRNSLTKVWLDGLWNRIFTGIFLSTLQLLAFFLAMWLEHGRFEKLVTSKRGKCPGDEVDIIAKKDWELEGTNIQDGAH